MKWYWLVGIVVSAIGIVTSDATKRERWQAKADDKNAPNVDRLGSLLFLALATWQSIVLWWPR